MFHERVLVGVIIALIISMSCAYAQTSSGEDAMSLFFAEDDLIEVATKQIQAAHKAPAIVSVISEKEFRRMGARTVHDVIRRLPGFGLTYGPYGNYEIEVRGIKDLASSKVKLMLDGHTLKDDLTQAATWIFDTLSLENIKRIEIIRGPASALYGANAFVGVINFVTKDADDILASTAGVGFGSNNAKAANVLTGGDVAGWQYSFLADIKQTDGIDAYMAQDKYAQSGKVDFWQKQLDLAAKIKYEQWQLNARYMKKERGPYIGFLNALNDESVLNFQQLFLEAKYEQDLNDDMSFTFKGYTDRVLEFDQYWEFLPESIVPPNGMIANDTAKMMHNGLEAQLDYQTHENNLLTLGAMFEHNKLHDVHMYANYVTDSSLASYGTMLASVTDQSAEGNWIDETKSNRYIRAFYFQDMLSVANNVDLLFGARYDDYSDFGSHTSPKLALVWGFREDWTMKMLYATAFRAPTFAELYVTNNPGQLGNESLKPETADTFELSVINDVVGEHELSATYFYIKDENRLVYSPTDLYVINNDTALLSDGLELAYKKEWPLGHSFYVNYTHQRPRYEDGNVAVEEVARNKGNIGGNFVIDQYINLNVNVFGTGSKVRRPDDARTDDVDGYFVTDAALMFDDYYPGMQVRMIVNNLFDKEYYDPSPSGTTVSDHPREGRHYWLDVRYTF